MFFMVASPREMHTPQFLRQIETTDTLLAWLVFITETERINENRFITLLTVLITSTTF